MPTYEYKCKDCGHTFEYFQPMSADPLTKCPECGGNLKRIIGTGAGAIFKGSGFYQTDYKNNSNKNISATKSEKPIPGTEKKDKKEDKK